MEVLELAMSPNSDRGIKDPPAAVAAAPPQRRAGQCQSTLSWKIAGVLLMLTISALQIFLSYLKVYLPKDNDNTTAQVAPAKSGRGYVGDPFRNNQEYQPGSAEQYIMSNSDQLGFNKPDNPATCHIWSDPNATTPEVFHSLVTYKKDIDEYNEIIKKFKPIPSIMDKLRRGGVEQQSAQQICDILRLHPDGMKGIFPSEQLSFTSSGYVEPLLPPMRSHKICENFRRNLMSLAYLVHDFEFMCRKLKPTSRLVLLDMGAALDFHGTNQPIVTLLRQYEKFGFVFDHIYGFEIKEKDPKVVYEMSLPEEYMASYHWINIGVSAKEGDKLNPLHSVIKKFNEDDFVVVKLDIDTSSVEVPLALQLLEDKDGVYSKIIDQFY